MKVNHYTCRVTWSAKDDEYLGLCVEFPSLNWLATTPEAALKGIRQVAAEVVADMKANAEPVPAPLAEKTTAANSGCVSLHSYIGHWHYRPPSRVCTTDTLDMWIGMSDYMLDGGVGVTFAVLA